MEVLYAIMSILFLIAVIILMILLFRRKSSPIPNSTHNSGTKIHEFFGRKHVSDDNATSPAEYQLHYGARESLNETMRDTALDVVITHARDNQIKTRSIIQDDDKLIHGGVVVGREGCDYNMASLLLDRDGTFLIRRIGNNYSLVANRNSINGIRTEFGGEKKKKIDFQNGCAVCYVGPICFKFSVPGCEDAQESDVFRKASFYSDETLNNETQTFSLS